jgi:hypothetical protein
LASILILGALWAGCAGGGPAATSGAASGSPGAHGDQGGSTTFDPGSGSGTGQGQPSVLAFDPPALTLVLDGTTPQAGSFFLKASHPGGADEVVTPESVQFDRPDVAALQLGAPVVLTAPGAYAGTGTLHAIYQGHEATAKLTVQVHVTEVDPGAPAGAVAKLSGAGLPPDPALSSLLYPYDATVLPQGLASPLLMWSAPSASDVYRVHYEEQDYTFDGYYPITLPASLRAPQKVWDRLVASSPGGPLSLSLSRWDAATDTAYASAQQQWTIAPASLRGAIYYWTTSGNGQMARIQPGGAWESLNGGKCMGCHAVSSDGSTLVAAVANLPTTDGSGDDRAWVSFDLPSGKVRATSTFFGGNVAVNDDGKYVVFGGQQLRLGDTATGKEIPGSGLDQLPLLPGSVGVMTPAFSPDGKHLAVVEGAGGWFQNLVGGRLATLDFDPATRTFSGYTGLASASDFPAGQQAISYPTYTPDAQRLAFHVGDHATGCDTVTCSGFGTQIGTIAMASVSGGAPPVVLHTLADPVTPNPEDRNHTFEPTFNPIERGGYFWVVVTSMRDYGNRIGGTPDNAKKRLWVAAIDRDPAPGKDPSHPAFFLEGQDETTTNMRGFWALSACVPTAGGGGCSAGFECCSGFCDQGQCVTPQTFSCVGVGQTCASGADCCNQGVVGCVGAVCAPMPAK